MTGFFRKASSLAIAAIAASAISAAAANAKYIFYFIGDGMGIPEVTNAQLFNRNVLRNDTPLLMTTFPVVSMITTHSASSDVTDSAAAGTALAAGHKTINGMLGMTPDSVAVTSIAKTLFDNGYGIGLVTSVAIDDATPGAFYTHVPNRNQFYETGRMLAESGYQFFAGASLRGTKDQHGNDNGLVDYIRQNNVSVHYGLDSIDTTADRLLILSPFHETNNHCIGLTVDSIAGALTLPELTRTGLKHLQRVSPDRFFMMVEGGNIDHAGHGNDGGTSMREIINFNDAIRVAYDFYLQHPDETLIVITADHETGGMSVGCQETGYSVQLQNAAMQKVSKEAFNNYCHGIYKSRMAFTWDDMEQYLAENLGLGTAFRPSPGEMEEIKQLFNNVFEKRNAGADRKTLYASFNIFADKVFNLLNSKSGIGWTTGSHTGSPVPVYAIGVDARLFSPMHDNTDLPKIILRIAGK